MTGLAPRGSALEVAQGEATYLYLEDVWEVRERAGGACGARLGRAQQAGRAPRRLGALRPISGSTPPLRRCPRRPLRNPAAARRAMQPVKEAFKVQMSEGASEEV